MILCTVKILKFAFSRNIEGFTRHEALKAVTIRFAREVSFPVADANLETLNRDPLPKTWYTENTANKPQTDE